jgi:hypothetical protein
MGCKTTLASKCNFMPVFEIDMAAPCPRIGVRIFLQYADKGLIAVRIFYPVSLPLFHISFHKTTVVVVDSYSKRTSPLLTLDSSPEIARKDFSVAQRVAGEAYADLIGVMLPDMIWPEDKFKSYLDSG